MIRSLVVVGAYTIALLEATNGARESRNIGPFLRMEKLKARQKWNDDISDY